MELIKQQIRKYLTAGSVLDLLKAEKAIDFDVVLTTPQRPFMYWPEDREGELLKNIMALTARFIKMNFPDSDSQEVAMQFAVDVKDARPDWGILDILNFFKFIRHRQDLEECRVWGNKISPMKLMSLAVVYEEHKSIAREQMYRRENNMIEHGTQQERLQLNGQKMISSGEPVRDNRFKDLAESLVKKQAEIKQSVEKEAAERTARHNQFLRDLESHWQKLMQKVRSGEMSEYDAAAEHVKYRDSYFDDKTGRG